MTIVDLNNLGYRDEPFVLAKDVNKVFYLKDMCTKPKKGENNNNDSDNEPKRHIVLSRKRNIVGIEIGLTCQTIMKRMMEFRPSQ